MTVRAECPRSTVPEKVSCIPEFDNYIVTYMSKQGRDPCKGLEKGLKSAQDKFFDVGYSLAQVFALTDEAETQESPLGLIRLSQALCLSTGQRQCGNIH